MTHRKIKAIAYIVLFVFFFQITLAEASMPQAANSNVAQAMQFMPLASSFATSDRSYTPDTKTPYQMYLLQDAHGHVETQEKTAAILAEWQKKLAKKKSILFIEGASGRLSPENLSFFQSPLANNEVHQKMLGRGELNGAELYLVDALQKKEKSFEAFGLENPLIYKKGFTAMRRVLNQQTKAKDLMQKMREKFFSLASQKGNADLLKLFRLKESYRSEKITISEYLRELADLATRHLNRDLRDVKKQDDSPVLMRFLRLEENLKKDLSQIDASREFKEVMDLVGDQLQAQDRQHLQDAMQVANRGENEDIRFSVERLVECLQKRDLNINKWPVLAEFLGNQILRDEMQAEPLFREMDQLMHSLFDELAETSAEKALLVLFQNLDLMQNGLTLSWQVEDYELAKQNLGMNPAGAIARQWEALAQESLELADQLKQLQAPVREFYRINQLRERVFLRKIQKIMLQEKGENAIVLTGGFHAKGMQDISKTEGIAFQSFRPLTQSASNGREIYERAVMGVSFKSSNMMLVSEMMPFSTQEILSGDPLFVAGRATRLAQDLSVTSQRYGASPVIRDTLLAQAYSNRQASSLGQTLARKVLEAQRRLEDKDVFNEIKDWLDDEYFNSMYGEDLSDSVASTMDETSLIHARFLIESLIFPSIGALEEESDVDYAALKAGLRELRNRLIGEISSAERMVFLATIRQIQSLYRVIVGGFYSDSILAEMDLADGSNLAGHEIDPSAPSLGNLFALPVVADAGESASSLGVLSDAVTSSLPLAVNGQDVFKVFFYGTLTAGVLWVLYAFHYVLFRQEFEDALHGAYLRLLIEPTPDESSPQMAVYRFEKSFTQQYLILSRARRKELKEAIRLGKGIIAVLLEDDSGVTEEFIAKGDWIGYEQTYGEWGGYQDYGTFSAPSFDLRGRFEIVDVNEKREVASSLGLGNLMPLIANVNIIDLAKEHPVLSALFVLIGFAGIQYLHRALSQYFTEKREATWKKELIEHRRKARASQWEEISKAATDPYRNQKLSILEKISERLFGFHGDENQMQSSYEVRVDWDQISEESLALLKRLGEDAKASIIIEKDKHGPIRGFEERFSVTGKTLLGFPIHKTEQLDPYYANIRIVPQSYSLLVGLATVAKGLSYFKHPEEELRMNEPVPGGTQLNVLWQNIDRETFFQLKQARSEWRPITVRETVPGESAHAEWVYSYTYRDFAETLGDGEAGVAYPSEDARRVRTLQRNIVFEIGEPDTVARDAYLKSREENLELAAITSRIDAVFTEIASNARAIKPLIILYQSILWPADQPFETRKARAQALLAIVEAISTSDKSAQFQFEKEKNWNALIDQAIAFGEGNFDVQFQPEITETWIIRYETHDYTGWQTGGSGMASQEPILHVPIEETRIVSDQKIHLQAKENRSAESLGIELENPTISVAFELAELDSGLTYQNATLTRASFDAVMTTVEDVTFGFYGIEDPLSEAIREHFGWVDGLQAPSSEPTVGLTLFNQGDVTEALLSWLGLAGAVQGQGEYLFDAELLSDEAVQALAHSMQEGEKLFVLWNDQLNDGEMPDNLNSLFSAQHFRTKALHEALLSARSLQRLGADAPDEMPSFAGLSFDETRYANLPQRGLRFKVDREDIEQAGLSYGQVISLLKQIADYPEQATLALSMMNLKRDGSAWLIKGSFATFIEGFYDQILSAGLVAQAA